MGADEDLRNQETGEKQPEKTNDKQKLADNKIDEIAEKSLYMEKTDFEPKEIIGENVKKITKSNNEISEYKSKPIQEAMDIDVILDDNLLSKPNQNGNVNEILLEKENIVENSFEENTPED